MAPKNGYLEDEFRLGPGFFQGRTVSFRKGNWCNWPNCSTSLPSGYENVGNVYWCEGKRVDSNQNGLRKFIGGPRWNTVDGSEIRLSSWYGKHPIIYKFLYIPGPRWCRISSIHSMIKLYRDTMKPSDRRFAGKFLQQFFVNVMEKLRWIVRYSMLDSSVLLVMLGYGMGAALAFTMLPINAPNGLAECVTFGFVQPLGRRLIDRKQWGLAILCLCCWSRTQCWRFGNYRWSCVSKPVSHSFLISSKHRWKPKSLQLLAAVPLDKEFWKACQVQVSTSDYEPLAASHKPRRPDEENLIAANIASAAIVTGQTLISGTGFAILKNNPRLNKGPFFWGFACDGETHKRHDQRMSPTRSSTVQGQGNDQPGCCWQGSRPSTDLMLEARPFPTPAVRHSANSTPSPQPTATATAVLKVSVFSCLDLLDIFQDLYLFDKGFLSEDFLNCAGQTKNVTHFSNIAPKSRQ